MRTAVLLLGPVLFMRPTLSLSLRGRTSSLRGRASSLRMASSQSSGSKKRAASDWDPEPSEPQIAAFPKNLKQRATAKIEWIEERLASIPEERRPRYDNFSFEVTHAAEDSRARTGVLSTPHGSLETPNFIFCGTKATVKGVTPQQLRDEGTQVILSNTYHLLCQPGPEQVERLGKVQRMSGWNGPMLTDSGGYQIFSMGHGSVSKEVKGNRGEMGWSPSLLSISEKGARFRNYRDGSLHCLTPESSIAAQRCIGADLIVVLDECTPFHVSKEYTESSMHRSHRWGLRSLEEFARGDDGTQALYGIIQGGVYKDLREQAAHFVNSFPFFGHAIGGSLGDSKETMYDIVRYTAERLSPERPIHLLGIGSVRDIFEGVRAGIDTFDCVHPTRIARHGGALVRAAYWEEPGAADGEGRLPREHVNLSSARFRDDPRPIDETCGCYTCRNFSRGYIHHLIKADESLAGTLLSLHNVHFMNRLMRSVRGAIRSGTLDEEQNKWLHPGTVSTF